MSSIFDAMDTGNAGVNEQPKPYSYVKYAGDTYVRGYAEIVCTDDDALQYLPTDPDVIAPGSIVTVVSTGAKYIFSPALEWVPYKEGGSASSTVINANVVSEYHPRSVDNEVLESINSSKLFVLKNEPTEAEAAYLSVGGNRIMIGSSEYRLAAESPYEPATRTVRLSVNSTFSAGASVYSEDEGNMQYLVLDHTWQELYDIANNGGVVYVHAPEHMFWDLDSSTYSYVCLITGVLKGYYGDNERYFVTLPYDAAESQFGCLSPEELPKSAPILLPIEQDDGGDDGGDDGPGR